MNDYNMRINQLIPHFDEKQNKKLETDLFVRLCVKVGEADAEITKLISETFVLLLEIHNNKDAKRRSYIKTLNLLKKTVRKTLGFTPKGALAQESIAIGIALGTAFGSAFIGMNPGLIGLGLPLGLVFGSSIGKKRETEAEAAGNTY